MRFYRSGFSRSRAAKAATATWPCQALRLGAFFHDKLNRIAAVTRATARRRSFAAFAEHRPEGPLMRERQNNGGAYRDRTDDPLLAKQVLSQLS